MNLCLRTKLARPSFLNSLFRYSTTTPEVVEQNEQVLIDDADEVRAREAEIEKKRNVSRLTSAHYNIMHDRRPYEEPRTSTHLTVKYNRRLYGKYGISSGVNPTRGQRSQEEAEDVNLPENKDEAEFLDRHKRIFKKLGICWPTHEEIKEKQEYEAVAFPFTIKEMMETAAQKRKEERLVMEEREQDIATKLVKLAQWKKDLKNKMAKKISEAETAKAKKERLVEEVRRHFGFKLDPRDERFQEMLAKREKEQKKAEKLAKKEAKEQMMIAKLQQTNAKITDNK